MPKLGINLISQSKLNIKYYTIFIKNNIYIQNKNITIIKGSKINNLYYLSIKLIIKNDNNNILLTSNLNKNISKLDLYYKFGHISLNYLNKLVKNTKGY
jgi:hypothetical protein